MWKCSNQGYQFTEGLTVDEKRIDGYVIETKLGDYVWVARSKQTDDQYREHIKQLIQNENNM